MTRDETITVLSVCELLIGRTVREIETEELYTVLEVFATPNGDNNRAMQRFWGQLEENDRDYNMAIMPFISLHDLEIGLWCRHQETKTEKYLRLSHVDIM